jgi:hypothetical protein
MERKNVRKQEEGVKAPKAAECCSDAERISCCGPESKAECCGSGAAACGCR